MTPRQARTERRAAERKAQKVARKATQHLALHAPHGPDPGQDTGQPYATDRAIQPRYNPELEDEFPREFQIRANSVRDRIARQVVSGADGFVSQNTNAAPAPKSTAPTPKIPPALALQQENWLRLAIL